MICVSRDFGHTRQADHHAEEEGGDTKPGPEPERLKLPDEDWKEAIRRALEKERPLEGWPERDGEDADTDEKA